MRAVALGLIACALVAGLAHAADPVCTTQTAVNGPMGKYISSYPNVDTADVCAAQCKATPDCAVFKHCNSQDACKNYWSRGGPDDEFKSCTLFTGPFTSSPPNDGTVAGITVGTCTGGSSGGATVPAPAAGPSCSTQTAVNGPTGEYISSYPNVDTADVCAEQCKSTPDCAVFKFCNSQDACKNYWSRGGPDDEYRSCTLFKGPFTSSPPNDGTVAGITIGTCAR